ncbi:MAG: hypothetical protein IT438_01755 [Phycisphaerales bacterium]|nr:hypothetical protein [Phycisphaerales bacterium]
MSAWVLLRHELPDGAWHHDWLIEPPGAGLSVGPSLIAFRVGPEIAWPPAGGFVATRMAPHRREYLTYEGPVSGGRGRVRRVAVGKCRIVDISDTSLAVAIEFERAIVLKGRAAEGAAAETLWRFDLESA